MSETTPLEVRNKIMEEVKLGERTIAAIAKDYHIPAGRVYNWISRGVSQDAHVVEIRRLRRKNKELYEIIGRLTEAVEHFKKK
ncbi:hypothetical protein GF360_03820 [candidate division WWE3 bacterium]|nr:hypothetical protein [candidate division WWE3 bacterium]